MSATKYGDCLITVATGDFSDAEGEALGLVPTHAYAVLQVRPRLTSPSPRPDLALTSP